MFFAAAVLAVLTLFFGVLLLFNIEGFKKMSQRMNKIVLDEAWFVEHRISVGLLMFGLSVLLCLGAYFLNKFGM